jgi:hypothetical protein
MARVATSGNKYCHWFFLWQNSIKTVKKKPNAKEEMAKNIATSSFSCCFYKH